MTDSERSDDYTSSNEVRIGGEEGLENFTSSNEVLFSELSIRKSTFEAKLDGGNILEAESSLREGLSLNFEEARALLGRLEYQKGNIQAALRVFDGIDLKAAVLRFQPFLSPKSSRKKGSINESLPPLCQHAASLVLEAIYLKSICLSKLGRTAEAAQECERVLDAVGNIFPQGIPNALVDSKLKETVSKAVELLPELWKQASNYSEAILAYRRALISQWDLDSECCARIQKAFAVFLLYGGIEATAPSLAVQMDDSFIPKNNLEEAILLLMILCRKSYLGITEWDPEILDHLTFALSSCSQTLLLAQQFEEALPGFYPRCERWNHLALCYIGAGQNKTALNLLRKSLKAHEKTDDLLAVLLAAKICSEDCDLASEGVAFARTAIANAQGEYTHLIGVGLHLLGVSLRKAAKVVSSDLQRSVMEAESLKSLNEAFVSELHNPELIFELGISYAEHRNVHVALYYVKQYIDATGGSMLKGWRLLALVFSAQRQYSEAEVAIDAALDEAGKWDQGPLLRLKAKLKIAQSLPTDAIEIYRFLLALVQAQRKMFGSVEHIIQNAIDNVKELEVWQDLATLYLNLSQWRDAEICLEKASALNVYSAATFQSKGVMYEAQGDSQNAMIAYLNALSLDLYLVRGMVSIGALLSKMGPRSLPAARSFLSDALRLDPNNPLAWYYLGLVYKGDGRITEASDCFQAASMLEELDPLESYSKLVSVPSV